MPKRTAEETSIMKIQKLSWASGQWYFRRRWTVMISVVAILEGRSSFSRQQIAYDRQPQ